MKNVLFIILILYNTLSFSQENERVTTEGEITEITTHRGKRIRETAIVKFNLEDGKEQLALLELFRIPFIGNFKSVGDKITIKYNRDDPIIVETVFGSFLNAYGMYILVFLGIIFSIKPFLKQKSKLH